MLNLEKYLDYIKELDSSNFSLHLLKVQRQQRLEILKSLVDQVYAIGISPNLVWCLSESHCPSDILTPQEWLSLMEHLSDDGSLSFWHMVLESGNLPLVRVIRTLIAQPDFEKLVCHCDSKGRSSLHLAADSNLELLTFLIDYLEAKDHHELYRQFASKDIFGANVLQMCCYGENKTAKVREVINRVKDHKFRLLFLLADADECLRTPLHIFCNQLLDNEATSLLINTFTHLDISVIRALIKRTDYRNWTLLHLALSLNNSGLLSLLLQTLSHEDIIDLIKIVPEEKYTLFHLCLRSQQNIQIFNLLIKYVTDESLSWFSKMICYEDAEGQNMLQYAAQIRDRDTRNRLVRYLISILSQETLCSIRIKSQALSNSKNGVTAVHSAVSHKDRELCDILLTGMLREDVIKVYHLQDCKGDTLLHRGAFLVDLETFRALVDIYVGYGADIRGLFSTKNKREKNVLHCASYGHHGKASAADIILSHFPTSEEKFSMLSSYDALGDNPVCIAVSNHNDYLVTYFHDVLVMQGQEPLENFLTCHWPNLHRAIQRNEKGVALSLMKPFHQKTSLRSSYICKLDVYPGQSALHYIASEDSNWRHEFLFSELLPRLSISEILTHTNILGQTIIHCAVIANNVNLAHKLIEHIKDRVTEPDLSFGNMLVKQDWYGKTIVRYAVENFNITTLEYLGRLLPEGALTRLMQQRDTVLQRNCFHHVIAYNAPHSSVETMLNLASDRDMKTLGNTLLMVDSFGKTPLHYSVETNQYAITQLLFNILRQTKVTTHQLRQLILQQDKFHGRTALHYAARLKGTGNKYHYILGFALNCSTVTTCVDSRTV